MSDKTGLTREKLDVVLRASDDARARIAAGKVQRWEVLKWSVTVNIAFAAASTATSKQGPMLFCTVLISALASFLVYYYNQRMTRARETLTSINKFLNTNVIDMNIISGVEFDKSKTPSYDREELYLFGCIIWLSIVPTVFMWSWKY